MSNDSRSRKWLLTQNNPSEYGVNREIIELNLGTLKLDYYCFADEIGIEKQTYHTHIFLYRRNPIRFKTIQKLFPHIAIALARGSCIQNKEYVSKTGKWEGDKKEDTKVEGTFRENGEIPVERDNCNNALDDLYAMIKDGMSNYDILEQDSKYMLQLDKLDKLRQTVLEEKYKDNDRNIEVHYIWGKSGTGKTYNILEKYGRKNVYRITDSKHPFDNYLGQNIIMFEEFRYDYPIKDMLNYLDKYPLTLPSRYNNKIACYEKVFITTNIDIFEQYENIQEKYPETWIAFLRRINDITYYKSKGDKEELDTVEYVQLFENNRINKIMRSIENKEVQEIFPQLK